MIKVGSILSTAYGDLTITDILNENGRDVFMCGIQPINLSVTSLTGIPDQLIGYKIDKAQFLTMNNYAPFDIIQMVCVRRSV